MKLLFDHNSQPQTLPPSGGPFSKLHTNASALLWNRIRPNCQGTCKGSKFHRGELDKDFADLAFLRGSLPKIIWLRCGNSKVAETERLLRLNFVEIQMFHNDSKVSVLEIWPPSQSWVGSVRANE